ncbi:putative lipid II flippase FtsW [Latilactobacillus curvatus]|uniref:FtsW/RodA/SpoVE family cell cycle protein n=1 Tax=Latilactobacillus curvatus TaxID=28038 RepID=UPI0020C74F05|nr:putative lipid II flippase FtsW [Latilactobacillus curvatus]MCP8864736.1 putative lipid II flippase FtsW [Latilactobacillus curvatus]MCP8873611.1 putative lipid II flippase FtsW [Latilactobacillus curvatus]MCP8875424.1 putative lipid II flippase FtsW [Latilactobacillus curvatus]MCP8878997.1 putative lipid II flippase FtsW [Latilactobacillus curvatus]
MWKKFQKSKIQYLDYWLLLPYVILCAFGALMVYSASSDLMSIRGMKPDAYFTKQLVFIALGFILMMITYFLKLSVLKNRTFLKAMTIVVFLALIYLLLLSRFRPSAAINGATAWIQLGPLTIQPSEFTKLLIVIYLANMLSRKENELADGFVDNLKLFFSPVVLVAGIILLVFIQPDLGGASILAAVMVVMFFGTGMSYWYGFSLITAVTTTVMILFSILRHFNFSTNVNSYKFNRILSFLHPFELENMGGSQLVNSYYAINNGGWFGLGLGNSIQKRGYLPEPYTDFILSITTEELGVIGTLVIIALLFALLARIFYLGIHATKMYHTLLCYGIGTIIFVQTLFNVGGLLGILPITGVTLPFISYGGSSMMVLAIALGIVLNISAQEKKAAAAN